MSAIIVTNESDSGPGSLRDAILNTTEDGVITFDVSVNTIQLLSSLSITESMTIDGLQGRSNNITITKAPATPQFSLLNINSSTTPARVVILNGLTLTGGDAVAGGAITNSSATLNITNSRISDNNASRGAGINIDDGILNISDSQINLNIAINSGGGIYATNSSLNIISSSLNDNESFDGSAIYMSLGTLTIDTVMFGSNNATGKGGAIYSELVNVTITNSTLSNNSANREGGAIFSNDLSLEIDNSAFISNTSVRTGGAIHHRGTPPNSLLNLDTVIFNSNISVTDGGAIYADNTTLSLTLSTFQGNNAGIRGGALFLSGVTTDPAITFSTFNQNSATINGGAITTTSTSLINISDSTISRNIVQGNNNTAGAGIYHGSSLGLNISNSTIAENTLTESTSFVETGGAIYVSSAPLVLVNVTIVNNTAEIAGGVFLDPAVDPATSFIENSIIDLNIVNDVDGNFTSSGYNIFGTVVGSTVLDPTDQTGISAVQLNLGPLQNNGGPTETIALLEPSIAIDNGGVNDPSRLYDQRGTPFLRVVNGTLDAGAFEFAPGVVCYSGESLILTKNIITNEIKQVKAKKVYSDTHLVFDSENSIFVPVKLNIVTGNINRFMYIKKDSIDKSIPSSDFYVTSGHILKINGKMIKARDVNEAVRVSVPAQKVYSICTDKKTTILINGMEVTTWGYADWIKYAKKIGLSWINNQKQNNLFIN